MDIPAGVLKKLASEGRPGKIVSIARLDDLQQEIESKRRLGLLDEELFQRYLSDLTFRPPENFPQARSIIAVASPDPQVRVTFAWKGTVRHTIVPPTYLHGGRINTSIEETLTQFLRPAGYRVVPALLPRKLLAVRSGLAHYGKNNITYIVGMGSFHRLAAFYSDLPPHQDDWREPAMMERCETCSVCRKVCPTGAIPEDHFLLCAERCIVYHNEKPGDVPFPDWMDPSWHNCLVGCMLCQRACPVNRDVLASVQEGATLSQRETDLLLNDTPLDELPATTRKKLKESDLVGLMDVLPRNLKALLDRSES